VIKALALVRGRGIERSFYFAESRRLRSMRGRLFLGLRAYSITEGPPPKMKANDPRRSAHERGFSGQRHAPAATPVTGM